MFQELRKRWFGRCLGGAAWLALAAVAQAQGTVSPIPVPTTGQTVPGTAPLSASANSTPQLAQPVVSSASADELKARIDRLEKQNQDLRNAVNELLNRPVPAQPVATPAPSGSLSVNEVQSLVNQYLDQKDAEKKAAEKASAAEGHKVGSDLSMTATWENGVWLRTKNNDFSGHIGGEMQYDTLWFGQNDPLYAKKGAAAKTPGYTTGDSLGGTNELVDSTDFRRLRLWAEGGFWEVGEFMFQPKLEKIVNGQVGLDEMWVGVKDIPFLGTIRVGHHKTPQGLESDDWSSNRTFTYMERSTMSNAFFQNFGTGIIFTNNIAQELIGQRATYAAMLYKPQDGENGAQYADGDYAFTGRMSALLIDANEGRHLLHVGLSGTYRHNRNGSATVSATPEMFDYNGGDNAYGTATTAGGNAVTNMNASVNGVLAGNTNPNGANAAALVSTGAITSTAQSVFGAEMLYICGPFSIQAEYAALTFVDSLGAGGHKGSTGDLTVSGGYISVNYILTGENRTYDYRLGRIGTNYLVPRTPFWLVRDDNGRFNSGLGAWEIEARVSHLDLNTKDINGGETDAVNIGLVWHLNNNLRVTFDYLRQNRYDLPKGVDSGWLSGFGIRTQLQF